LLPNGTRIQERIAGLLDQLRFVTDGSHISIQSLICGQLRIGTTFETYTLKLEIENASDAGESVVIKGKDANNNDVTIQVTLANPTATNAQIFKGPITFFSKPMTVGNVNLFAVNGVNEEQIGAYEATETTASYHRYAVPNEPTINYLDVLCKIRFVPCVYDTDEVIVSNLGALKNMLMSLKWEDEGDMERSEMYFMKALQLLNGLGLY